MHKSYASRQEEANYLEYATTADHPTITTWTSVLIITSSDQYPVDVNLCRKCRCRIRNVVKYAMYWLCDDGNP